MKNIKCTLALLIVLTAASNSYADRSDYIRQYLDSSGFIKGLSGMFDVQAEMTLKNINRKHNISKEFKKDFRDVWNDVMIEDFWSTGGFFDLLKPMFDNFSNQELRELVRFYQSPVGRKMAKLTYELPSYIRSMMPAWEKRISKKILPEMLKKLEDRGWDHNAKRIR